MGFNKISGISRKQGKQDSSQAGYVSDWEQDTREGCPYISHDHMKPDGAFCFQVIKLNPISTHYGYITDKVCPSVMA